MRFVSRGIGEFVVDELEKASEACLAMAFFNPGDRMLVTDAERIIDIQLNGLIVPLSGGAVVEKMLLF